MLRMLRSHGPLSLSRQAKNDLYLGTQWMQTFLEENRLKVF